jgi:hypothetical protein
MPVDMQQTPFPSTLNPLLIRPSPPRQKYFTDTCPIPPNGMVFEDYKVAKRHNRRAEHEILVLVYGHYDFPKPSVHGLPTVDDLADGSCRAKPSTA